MVLKRDVYPGAGYQNQAYTSHQAGYVPSSGGFDGGYQSYGAPGMTAPGGYNGNPMYGSQNGYPSGAGGAYGTYPQGPTPQGYGSNYGAGPNYGSNYGAGPTYGSNYGAGPTYGSNYGGGRTYGQQYPGAGYHSVKDIDDEE